MRRKRKRRGRRRWRRDIEMGRMLEANKLFQRQLMAVIGRCVPGRRWRLRVVIRGLNV